MAKSQERGIVHVKDVFGRSGEASRKIGHSTGSSAQTNEWANFQRTLESNNSGSNGDIIYKKPADPSGNNNRDGKTNWKPVPSTEYGVSGMTRTFGKKKQAPLPPTPNSQVVKKDTPTGKVNKNIVKDQVPSVTNNKSLVTNNTSNIKQSGLKGKTSGNVTHNASNKDSAHMAGRSQLVPAPARSQTSQAFRHTQTPSKPTTTVPNGVAGVEHNKYRPNVNVNVNGYNTLSKASHSYSPTRTTTVAQTKDVKPASSAVYTANTSGVKKQVFSNGVHRSSVRQSSGSETGSSGYHSEGLESPHGMKGVTTRTDSDSAFGEDECTLQFGDEEDARVAQGKHTQVFKEYDGDDFAQYLKDDTCEYEYPTQRRNYRKNKTKGDMSPPMSPMSPNTLERQKKAGLKDKLSSVFTLSKTEKRRYYKNVRNASTSIHNFTFSDTKMGLSLERPEGSNPTDVQSDIGGYATSAGSWWGKDTLSSRNLKSRSEIGGLSKSMANLSASQSGRGEPHYSTLPAEKTEGLGDSTVGKKKKSNNIFRKVSQTLRRKKPNLYNELSIAPTMEDTRL